MSRRLQVVEPTLEDFAGHCYSLVASLCRALEMPIDLWAARGAGEMDFGRHVDVHPYFRRRIRVLQQPGLYRRLLRQGDPLLVTTARRSDLVLLDWVASGALPEERVFVYFHWFRESPKRMRFLQKIARRQPNLVVFGTTHSVVDCFRRAGFRHVFLLPYPAPAASLGTAAVPFQRLLYAGAARRDKGFRQVVDLVALLAHKKEHIPIVVQASPEHFGKYDAETLADIARLRGIGYPHLEILEHTLRPEEYTALFPGSICLQPYDRAEFRDRVSGVTLDALSQGCPVIVTSGTWSAEQIGIAKAGMALDEPTAHALYDAVKRMIPAYAAFRNAALEAGRARDRQTWTVLRDHLD